MNDRIETDASEVRREKHLLRLQSETRMPECKICGENEPAALTRIYPDIICYECKLIADGKSPIEGHHLSGRHNDRNFTLPLPGNMHRVASDIQKEWPVDTLRNPDASPLLKASAALRGFLDLLRMAINYVLGWIPNFLESVDAHMRISKGEKWWTQMDYQGRLP